MPQPDFWSRIKSGRLIQVLAVYLGASWVLLQVVNELSDALSLPEWIGPVAVILLAIGLLIILATAWVQSMPGLVERARREDVPHSWELDLGDAARAVVRGRIPHLNWARALAGGALAFLFLFGFSGLYVVIQDRGRTFLPAEAMADPAAHGVAVLPFHVTGESIRDWREGMVDLLSTGLDGAGGLRAIASPTVLARWSEAVPEAQRNPPTSVALEVARRSGARYALLGQAVAIGPTVRITADVHELEHGERLGQIQAEGPPDSVLALVDRLAVQTIGLLSGWEEAERSYERAVELAPGFAPYHIHLVEAAARFHADSALLRQRLDAVEPAVPSARRAVAVRGARAQPPRLDHAHPRQPCLARRLQCRPARGSPRARAAPGRAAPDAHQFSGRIRRARVRRAHA